MGQFSWLDCKTGEQIVDGRKRNSYVLVPRRFGGGHIEEPCYEGYGVFGGKDVYDLVALWNREFINVDENLRKPLRERFTADKEGERFFQLAVESYQERSRRLEDFVSNVEDADMKEMYGDEYLRLIGIDIACYDEENENLRFPIKITHDPNAVYEFCAPSLSDPNQGWLNYE